MAATIEQVAPSRVQPGCGGNESSAGFDEQRFRCLARWHRTDLQRDESIVAGVDGLDDRRLAAASRTSIGSYRSAIRCSSIGISEIGERDDAASSGRWPGVTAAVRRRMPNFSARFTRCCLIAVSVTASALAITNCGRLGEHVTVRERRATGNQHIVLAADRGPLHDGFRGLSARRYLATELHALPPSRTSSAGRSGCMLVRRRPFTAVPFATRSPPRTSAG